MNEATGQPEMDLGLTVRLWHDVRSALDVIMGFAELLLQEAREPRPAVSRVQVETVLQAGRQALWLTNHALPESALDISPESAARLRDALREPRDRIVRTADVILNDPAVISHHPRLTADVRRIRDAAAAMLSPPAPAAVGPAEVKPAEVTDPAAQRLLVAGGSDSQRAALEHALARQGYRVDWTAEARGALNRLQAEQYHLVLLGEALQDADSLELLQIIRARTAVPVILLSSGRDAARLARGLALGADDYVSEPLDPVVVRLRVVRSLERRQLRDREVAYLSKLDKVVDAARAVVKGEYRLGQLNDLAGAGERLEPIVQAFEKMAAKAAADARQAQSQWGDASIYIDASQVKALQAEIEAAKKRRE